MYRCFYCRTVSNSGLPFECGTCTVSCDTYVNVEATYGSIRQAFFKKYSFQPDELFPWMKHHKDSDYCDNSITAEAVRGIYAEEDHRCCAFFADVAPPSS